MRLLTRAAGRLRRYWRVTPEWRAWKAVCRQARRVPRRTRGRVRLAHYDIAYADLLTVCPQWHDLFVRRTLDIRFAKADPVILDCGANIGLAALFFKRRYPAARIVAFEADPTLAAILADNLKRNDVADVDVVAAAVWTYTGTVAFREDGADSGAIALQSSAAAGGVRDVPCVRLRDIIERERVDLLKLDVEGAEADLLVDCAPALAHVHAVAVEVHETEPSSRRLPTVLSVLENAGFAWSLDQLTRVPWASSPATRSPFPGAEAAWVVLVRAWRREEERRV